MDEIDFKNGAKIDTRPAEEKAKDFKLEELVASAAPVAWKEKERAKWRTFPDQQQDGSGSCVAQTAKKLAGINLWLKEGTYVEFSATPLYAARSNRPEGGMIGVEAFEIWRKDGMTLEALVSSKNMSDAAMDSAKVEQYEKDIAKVFCLSNHVGLPTGDIDIVASTIQQTGKGVMTWFYFTNAEWSPEVPVIKEALALNSSKALRHSVTAVDFFLYQGKKALLIEDSAHFGGRTRRIVTEDFFKARNWYARYGTTFKFQEGAGTVKPKHTFLRDLAFSEIFFTDTEVAALQDCLKYDGSFPANADSTGYYGAVTAKAVMAFQRKYAVASEAEIISLQGRKVGPKTRAVLNELFA